MKKVLVMLAAGAVAIAASADITAWNWTGGVINPALPSGTPIVGGAITVNIDHSPFVVDNGGQLQINISDIQGVIGVADLAIAPVFLGGTYSTGQVDSDGSAVGIGYLVIDANGGGIEVGDLIGFGASAAINDLQPNPGDPVGTPQTLAGGSIQTNVQVVPEPATIGLMGIAGLGMYLARRKVRR
jgi:hypothetical protein